MSKETMVWPSIRANNAKALIKFLVDAFGFEATAVFGEGERVDHAQLGWPLGGGLMLGSTREDDGDPWPQQPGTAGIYVVCDEPDALFARATAAGASVVDKLSDTDYGSRQFVVRDIEGNLWCFGTYKGESSSSSS